jgi:hypothetical protein
MTCDDAADLVTFDDLVLQQPSGDHVEGWTVLP